MSSQHKTRIVVGIESSCDETSLCLLRVPNLDQNVSDFEWVNSLEILANVISSQVEIHKQYGGVVPEIGARKHANQIHFLWLEMLAQLNQDPESTLSNLERILVTTSPGLVSALRVGHEFAKTLKFFLDEKYGLNIEIQEVNHLRGHMASALMSSS